MATANNGILICVLLFWWGVSSGDKWMMAAALSAAGLSWVVNVMIDRDTSGIAPAVTAIIASCAVLFGFGRAFLQLI